jgi:hypothetical protein
MQHYDFHESDTHEQELFINFWKNELQFYVAEGLQCQSLQTYLNMHPKNWTSNRKLL